MKGRAESPLTVIQIIVDAQRQCNYACVKILCLCGTGVEDFIKNDVRN